MKIDSESVKMSLPANDPDNIAIIYRRQDCGAGIIKIK